MAEQDSELELARLGWRADAIDTWRHDVVDPGLAGLRKDIDRMINSGALASEVAAKVHADRRRLLTVPQKLLAMAVAATVITETVVTLYLQLKGHH